MPVSTGALIEAFNKLDREEQIRLVEELWDKIAESSEPFPVSENQMAELRRRKENHLAEPQAGVPWSELKSRLLESD